MSTSKTFYILRRKQQILQVLTLHYTAKSMGTHMWFYGACHGLGYVPQVRLFMLPQIQFCFCFLNSCSLTMALDERQIQWHHVRFRDVYTAMDILPLFWLTAWVGTTDCVKIYCGNKKYSSSSSWLQSCFLPHKHTHTHTHTHSGVPWGRH